MSKDKGERRETTPAKHSNELDTKARIAMGSVGLALLITACVAVLTADNELGTVAVALVGGALLAMSSLGWWPTRISWGDRSAEWSSVTSLVTAAANTPDRKQKQLLLGVARSVVSGRTEGPGGLEESIESLSDYTERTRQSDIIHALRMATPDDELLVNFPEGPDSAVDAELFYLGDEEDLSRRVGMLIASHPNAPLGAKAQHALGAGYGSVIIAIDDEEAVSSLARRFPDFTTHLAEPNRKTFVAPLWDHKQLEQAMISAVRALPQPDLPDDD